MLYEILVEETQFGPRDLPEAEDREWLVGAALECLSWGMTRAIASGPNGLLARLERSHSDKEFGRQ